MNGVGTFLQLSNQIQGCKASHPGHLATQHRKPPNPFRIVTLIPMKHTIQKTDSETARLIIEWQPLHGKAIRPCVIRYCLDHEGCLDWEQGAVLGFHPARPCALILLVRRGDLISIGQKIIGGGKASRIHYQIGPDYELLRFEIPDSNKTNLGIRARLLPAVSRLRQLPACDDSLRDFLADGNHPQWLTPILARQKRKWRKNRTAKLYHLVPTEVADQEIPNCVAAAPGAALRFFRDRIDSNELRQCIGRDLETAVLYAMNEMSETQLDRACLELPTLLLKHHASKLSDERLILCVSLDPFEGFRIRNQLAPHLHARVLACTLGLPFGLFDSGDLSGLPSEVLHSFLNFTQAWVNAFDGNYQRLLSTLMRHRGTRSASDFLLHLLKHVPAEHLPHVARFAAGVI